MIPMGTIMAACLVFGGVSMMWVTRFPRPLMIILGLILLAAGLWNAGWHGLRHFQQFWGQMAFWSGLVLLLSGTVCLRLSSTGTLGRHTRLAVSVLAVLLLVFGAFYSWTIYTL